MTGLNGAISDQQKIIANPHSKRSADVAASTNSHAVGSQRSRSRSREAKAQKTSELPKVQEDSKKKEESKKPSAGANLLSDLTDGLKERVNETKLEMKVKDHVQLGIEA